ncbi:hypothetical protein ACFX14_012369 [Malus domestica]
MRSSLMGYTVSHWRSWRCGGRILLNIEKPWLGILFRTAHLLPSLIKKCKAQVSNGRNQVSVLSKSTSMLPGVNILCVLGWDGLDETLQVSSKLPVARELATVIAQRLLKPLLSVRR